MNRTDEMYATSFTPAQKRTMWLKIAGGLTLLTVGYVLYKRNQTKLGTTLMANSVGMITGALPS